MRGGVDGISAGVSMGVGVGSDSIVWFRGGSSGGGCFGDRGWTSNPTMTPGNARGNEAYVYAQILDYTIEPGTLRNK